MVKYGYTYTDNVDVFIKDSKIKYKNATEQIKITQKYIYNL